MSARAPIAITTGVEAFAEQQQPGTQDEFPSPTARDRIISLLSYLGLAPIFYFFTSTEAHPYRRRHIRQALAIFFVLLCIVLLFVVVIAVLSYLLVFHRHRYQDTGIEAFMLNTVRRFFLAWLVVYGAGLVTAAWGSYWEAPLLWRLARRPRWLTATALSMCAVYVVLAVVGTLATHASVITRADGAPASVYLVIDDLDFYPRWLFALGAYPIALTTRDVYGPNEIVVTKLTRQSLETALKHGAFVFVGSHGTEKGLLIERRYVPPVEVKALGTHANLEYVYLTGCDSGAQAAEWEAALAPAEVRSFDRLSAIAEHVIWLWFRGPAKVRSVAST